MPGEVYMPMGVENGASLLQRSAVPAFWVVACVLILFMVLLFNTYKKTNEKLFLLVGAFAFGLFYEAFILALGSTLGEGLLIMALTRVRYILYGILIPGMFLVCAFALDFQGKWQKAAWISAVVFMLLGVVSGSIVSLTPETDEELFRYAVASPAIWETVLHGIVYFGAALVLLGAGVAVWVKWETPRLLIAGLLMLACVAASVFLRDAGVYVSVFGQILVLLFLYLYARWEAQLSLTE